MFTKYEERKGKQWREGLILGSGKKIREGRGGRKEKRGRKGLVLERRGKKRKEGQKECMIWYFYARCIVKKVNKPMLF